MNQMGYVTYLQGAYDDAMADVGTTTLEFVVPDTGQVLLMGQATALCDDSASRNHTVGVVFTLYDENDNEVGAATGFAKGLYPGHSTVCMTYVVGTDMDAGTTAKICISTSPSSYGNGRVGRDDYYSIAVVELEHSVELKEDKA